MFAINGQQDDDSDDSNHSDASMNFNKYFTMGT